MIQNVIILLLNCNNLAIHSPHYGPVNATFFLLTRQVPIALFLLSLHEFTGLFPAKSHVQILFGVP